MDRRKTTVAVLVLLLLLFWGGPSGRRRGGNIEPLKDAVNVISPRPVSPKAGEGIAAVPRAKVIALLAAKPKPSAKSRLSARRKKKAVAAVAAQQAEAAQTPVILEPARTVTTALSELEHVRREALRLGVAPEEILALRESAMRWQEIDHLPEPPKDGRGARSAVTPLDLGRALYFESVLSVAPALSPPRHCGCGHRGPRTL